MTTTRTPLDNIPMLADSIDPSRLDLMLHDDAYVMEQKLDGHRVVLRIQDGLAPLGLTRGGNPYTKGLPKGLGEGFPEGRWVLDGELIAEHSGGDGIFWVFDMLDANGLIDEQTPLRQRRVILETFMERLDLPKIRLVPQAQTTDEKQALVQKCRASGAEGVMVKVRNGVYRPGARSKQVLKAKFVETADVIVLGLRTDGKDSVDLGAYVALPDNNIGPILPVGRASLIGKEKKGAFQIGDVLEVRYLYMGAGNRLFQPTVLRRRDDKLPVECTTAQFKHVSKTVLASL